jgi:hypothetical protein
LQHLLSRALETTYDKSPHIQNELVNRHKPSSTANAARKKLLIAMLENSGKEDLGFTKFPAEKAMYRSLLLATGVHGQYNGVWRFQAPPSDSKNLLPAWGAIESFLDGTEHSPQSLNQLFGLLASAPYGVKQGLLPILFLSFYLAYSDEMALYDNGHYCPFISQEIVERILREPQAFGVQRFKADPVRESIFRAYIDSFSTTGDMPKEINLIAAAKPLAKFMMNLTDYAKTTKSISHQAQMVREQFFASKSPLQLLFFQIPESLGVRPLIGEGTSQANLAEFSGKLKSAVAEIRKAYHALLNDFLDQLRVAFAMKANSDIETIKTVLSGRHDGLQDYTIDVHGLKAFIGRLTDKFGDEKQWLVSLASFLARKPPEKWTDDDVLAVKYRLRELSKKIRELEKLRFHNQERGDKGTDVELVLLKSVSHSAGETSVVVALDRDKRKRVEKKLNQVSKLLAELGSEDLENAVLAMVLARRSRDLKAALTENEPIGKEGSAIG